MRDIRLTVQASLNKFIYIFQISTALTEHIHTRVINAIGDHVAEDVAVSKLPFTCQPH